jgi:hypothetical protein
MWRTKQMLFNAAEDGFESGSGGDMGDLDSIISGGNEVQEEFDLGTDEGQPATASGGIDYAALARANSEALGPLIERLTPREQPAAQMSEEEFRKLTKHYEPSDTELEAMFGDGATKETRLQALRSMISGAVNHANAVAGLGIKSVMGQFEQQLAPLQAQQREVQKTTFERGLTEAYPQLKPFLRLVPQAVAAVQAAGIPINSDAEARQHVARMTAILAKQLGVDAPAVQRPGRQGMPRMAAMTGSGNTSSAGGGGKKPAWQNVLNG